jgi:hypothetical protein
LPPTATPSSLARWPVPSLTTASMASFTVATTLGRKPRSTGASNGTGLPPMAFIRCGCTSLPPLATAAAIRAICTGVSAMAWPMETDIVSAGNQRTFCVRIFHSGSWNTPDISCGRSMPVGAARPSLCA